MQYTMSAALSGFLNPQYLWYDPGENVAEEVSRLLYDGHNKMAITAGALHVIIKPKRSYWNKPLGDVIDRASSLDVLFCNRGALFQEYANDTPVYP